MSAKKCRSRRGKSRTNKKGTNYFPFDHFPTYTEIKLYLGELCRTYPDLATLELIGITRHKIEICLIKLQKDPCSERSRRRDVIFIDAGIHAREWITISTAMYLINYVITNNHLLDHTNYYIVPCINVDGYNLTHSGKCYRLWRKNCAYNCSSDIALQGVDINRNFPIGFAMPGSSDDPGAYNYRGEEPLSEPSSRALSFAFKKYECFIKMYISLHCYGNAILYPWSFSKESVSDCQDLHACGLIGQEAFLKASHGKRNMKVGSAAEIMNLAAGTSTDYARYVHSIKFVYIIELQGYGTSGFTPDKKHIPIIGNETTMAILAMAQHVQKYFQRVAPRAGSKRSRTHLRDAAEDDSDRDDDKSRCKKRQRKRHRTNGQEMM